MQALIVLSVLAFLPSAYAATPAQTTNGAAQPATWLEHNLIVNLNNLPKNYSCDDLWYKFRDVLLAIGARADYKITTYQCGKDAGVQGRSPRVQLSFWLPKALTPAQQQWSDVSATPRTVKLQPGEPSTLTPVDCDLVSQMNALLFPAIPLKVVSSQLNCSASSKSQPHFELSVAALTPVESPGPAAAAEPRR